MSDDISSRTTRDQARLTHLMRSPAGWPRRALHQPLPRPHRSRRNRYPALVAPSPAAARTGDRGRTQAEATVIFAETGRAVAR